MLVNRYPLFYFDKDEGAGGSSGEQETPNPEIAQGSDGKSETPQIDWAKIEIPKDVLENHPEYKKLKDESIKRRKQIAELKKAVSEDDGDQNSGQKPAAKTADIQTVDIEKLSPFERMLWEELQKNNRLMAEQSANTAWTRISTEFGFDDEDREFVSGTTYEEMKQSAERYAKRVGAKAPQAESGIPGVGRVPSINQGFKNRMAARMQGKDTQDNPFDPGLHKQLGGRY